MWKIRASTLIRQTLRAELCVIYPLLALWNKFSLFHWNLKEGTENKSSLGVSWLTRGGQRVKGQNQLTPSCECVSAHPYPHTPTHTHPPTYTPPNTHSPPTHNSWWWYRISISWQLLIDLSLLWSFQVKKFWSTQSFILALPISVRWEKGIQVGTPHFPRA